MINPRYVKAFSDDNQVRTYVRAILHEGCAELSDFLTPAFFAEVKDFAERVCAENIEVSELREETPTLHLARSVECLRMFDAMHRLRCEAEGRQYTPLLRDKQRGGMTHMVAAGARAAEGVKFHYDGAYVNAIIGVIEPPEGSGMLHLFPNLRPRCKSVLLGQVVARMLRHARPLRALAGGTRVYPKANTLILFFGDRTLHGVEPVKSGKRAVLTLNSHW